LVRREVRRAGQELQVVDIEGDDALLAEFGMRIPVVLSADSEVLAEGQIEKRALRRAVMRTGGQRRLRRPR
jgi:hypothetical protein